MIYSNASIYRASIYRVLLFTVHHPFPPNFRPILKFFKLERFMIAMTCWHVIRYLYTTSGDVKAQARQRLTQGPGPACACHRTQSRDRSTTMFTEHGACEYITSVKCGMVAMRSPVQCTLLQHNKRARP